MSAKQAVNDKLQDSAATYLRCGGLVNNQIKKVHCRVCEYFFNRWIFGEQERGCLMHFARLANTLLKHDESARDNHVLACNFAK